MKKIIIYVCALLFFNTAYPQVFSIAQGLTVASIKVLPSDVINNNVTPDTMQDITGLSFPVIAGIYYFKFIISYTAQSASTGSGWSVNGPAFSTLNFNTAYSQTATSLSFRTAANTYDAHLISSASASTTSNLCTIEGFATFTTTGNLIGRFSSEVASSAITAKGGLSYLIIIKLN